MLLKIIQSKIWFYLIAGTGLAALQALSLCCLVSSDFITLFYDGLIFSAIYLLIAIPLLNVLKFGNLNLIYLPVRILNYFILAGFTLAVTLAAGYGLEIMLFDQSLRSFFISLLPLKALIAFLVYCLIISLNKETDNQELIQPDTLQLSEEPIEMTNPQPEKVVSEAEKPGMLERFAVKTGTKIHVVLVEEILCLIADGDYVQVITTKGKYLKEQTMKYFETNLPGNLFVRVHRSCIVNVTAISRIELYDKQSQQIMLKNGEKIRVSQAGYKMLREKLKL